MRALRLLRLGVSSTLSHFGLALAMSLLVGSASGAITATMCGQEAWFVAAAKGDQVTGLAYMAFADAGIQLLVTLFLMPLFQAATAFAAFRSTRGKPGTAYMGFNFAVSRYGRMLKPHALAWLAILVGMQAFLLPGILYWSRFAMVDAVAVFESSKAPLRRSRRLSEGYQRTIVLMAAPWIMYSVVAAVVDLQLAGFSLALIPLHHAALNFALFVLFTGYAHLYLERTGQHEAAPETAAAEAEG